jgi:hypothetical protein
MVQDGRTFHFPGGKKLDPFRTAQARSLVGSAKRASFSQTSASMRKLQIAASPSVGRRRIQAVVKEPKRSATMGYIPVAAKSGQEKFRTGES